jgi:hypothetical protein
MYYQPRGKRSLGRPMKRWHENLCLDRNRPLRRRTCKEEEEATFGCITSYDLSRYILGHLSTAESSVLSSSSPNNRSVALYLAVTTYQISCYSVLLAKDSTTPPPRPETCLLSLFSSKTWNCINPLHMRQLLRRICNASSLNTHRQVQICPNRTDRQDNRVSTLITMQWVQRSTHGIFKLSCKV